MFVTSACLALALTIPAVAGEIYRSVDENGVTVYTDRPPYPGAQPISIHSRPTDLAAVAEEQARLLGEDDPNLVPPPPAERARDPQAEAAQRAEQCRLARERAQTYATSQRLYEPLPDGGRRYLTDEELDRARDEAQQAVARFCED
jgi:hypothetical protein